MVRRVTAGLALAALLACGGKGGDQTAQADSLARDLELAPAESTTALNDQPPVEQQAPGETTPAGQEAAPAPAPGPPQPKPKPKPVQPPAAAPAPAPAPARRGTTLATGTNVVASADDSLHSRHDEAGRSLRATIGEDIKDAAGRVVIPAGSIVTFKVTRLEPAKNKSDTDGRINLTAEAVEIDGSSYTIAGLARTNAVEHELRGQGVTAGGAARVGGGAAAGAVTGKVIGGKTGAIIGGIAGAAGGAVLASKTADRDVVVLPGHKITFTLTADFTIPR